MMAWLVSVSLRHRIIVVALAVIAVVVSWRTLRTTPLDVFPEFAPPLVEVQTEAPGLSTSEVESLVTVPLEAALNGVPGLDRIRSKSVLGLSSVVLVLDPGTDILAARLVVQERLARIAPQLPAVARPPVMLSPLSSLSRVMKIGVTSEKLSQVELTTLAKWTVRPRLMSIPGVANVAIWGQRDRQLQVLVNPDRLRAHDLSIDDVVRAAGEGVSLQAGGFLDTPNQRLAVTHASAVRSTSDLESIVVAQRNGTALRIGDVATVVEGSPPPIGDAIINNVPGLLLIVEKQLGANTLQVTYDVEAALRDLAPALAGAHVDPTIFRPATFIEMSLRNLSRALFIGCILVILVLLVFLADWRTALISSIAIPLSLLTAGVLLHYRGGTLDTMVLAGLVIALGEVVDDAIIDVENIVRRLRLNATLATAAAGPGGRARRVSGSPERGALRQPDRDAGLRAGLPARGPDRRLLPAAGAGLRPRDSGIARRRADDYACARTAPAAQASRLTRRQGGQRTEDALSPPARVVRRPSESRIRDARGAARADGGNGAVPR